MKALLTRAVAHCVVGFLAQSALADITFFMARQGDTPLAAPSTIPLPRGASVCVNFYMSSNVTLVSKAYQFRTLNSTSPGVGVNCPSAQINSSEPRYPGYPIPALDTSGCPAAVREGGVAVAGVTITANTPYYLGEYCFDATLAASGSSTITYDSNSAQTFVSDASFANVPIANRFGGTILLGPPIPTLSETGLAVMVLALLAAGMFVLRKRVPVPTA